MKIYKFLFISINPELIPTFDLSKVMMDGFIILIMFALISYSAKAYHDSLTNLITQENTRLVKIFNESIRFREVNDKKEIDKYLAGQRNVPSDYPLQPEDVKGYVREGKNLN